MGIVRPVMEVYPLAWIFFVIFILITSFAVLNLFIGIIVDAMQQQSIAEKTQTSVEKDATKDISQDLLKEVSSLKKEIRDLKSLLQQ